MTDQDEMKGKLFRTDDEKRAWKSDNPPEYGGYVVVEGTKYYVSAWVRTSEMSGKKYFALSLKRAKAKSPALTPSNDPDVPF
jgi:hypothetical protein